MPSVDLTTQSSVDTANDSIVIQNMIEDIPGGRTLDATGYGAAVVDGIATLGAITAGSGYTNAAYTDVPLTGGTGSGATADITVAGGVITVVTLVEPGNNYTVADDLSAADADLGGGGGTGFEIPVATIASIVEQLVIKAGHVIIEETSSGDLKPNLIKNGVYDALVAGHTYKGILYASVLLAKPLASVMVRGTMNDEAAQNAALLPPVLAAAKTALPLIRFTKD